MRRASGQRAFLPADIMIGRRVGEIRKSKGKSQVWLGIKLGVTFQQIQKYETGDNRISAGKLLHIAHALGVPLVEFYRGIEVRNG